MSRRKPKPDEAISLKGKMVELREKRIEDAFNDYAWRVDEELAKLDATKPIGMAYNDFLRYSQQEIDRPHEKSKRFGIDNLAGKHIGNCMYYDINKRRRETEIGIMIGDRAYWSRGYGTDAMDTILKYIFTQTNLKRVYLHTLDWNYRAQKSFSKSGFRKVRKVQKRDQDFILMEILRSEWEEMYGSNGN